MTILKTISFLLLFVACSSNAQYASDDLTRIEFIEVNNIEISKEEAIKRYNLPEELPTWLMNDLIRVHNRIENVDALGATKEELITYKVMLIEKDTEIRELKTELQASNKRIDDLFEYGSWFAGVIGFLFIVFGISTYINAGSQAKKEVEKGVNDAKNEVINIIKQTKDHANRLISDLENHNNIASDTLKRLVEKEDSILNELTELESLIDDSRDLVSDLKLEQSKFNNFEDKFESLQSEVSKIKEEIALSTSEDVFEENSYDNIDIDNKDFNLAQIRENMKLNRTDNSE